MAEQWGSNDKVVDSSGGFGADDEIDQHNPLRRGWNKMTQSVGITGALATGDYKGGAQKIAEADTYQKQNPGTPEGRELMQAWERGDGISGGLQEVGKKFSKDWNESKSGFGAIRSVAKNLQAMGSGVLEQTPNMVAPMGLQLAGGAAGAAAGSTIPVVGTVAGGIAGALVGSSLGNTAVEGGHMTQEALQKAGVNPQDKQATEKYLSQNGDKLLGQAGVKGSIIGAVDTATMKLGHGLLTAPADAAAKRAITSLGLDAADSAAIKAASGEISKRMAADPIYKAAKSGTGGLARNAGVAALEPAGEFTGEYVGQGVATGDWNEKNAFLEAASSIGQGAATFAGQKAYAGMKSPFGKADEVVPGTPPAKQPPAPPLQIGNTPDPYISFPDGTVARQSEADAYVNSLPADQQPAARAKLMGLAPQPAKPSEQMGLKPTDGPSLTNAAITAVDSGAAQVNIDQAPAEQIDIVEQQRQQYQQETAALLAQQDQEAFDAYLAAIEDANTALDEAPGESVQALSQLDDISVPDIFDANSNTSDADFLRAMGATEQEIADAITNQPGSPQAGTQNPVGTAQDEPGSTGQGVGADQTKQANLERIRKANNVSPPDSVQPIPATSSGQDGNQPAASVGLGSTDGNGLGANAGGSTTGSVDKPSELPRGALRTPVAQGKPQPTALGTQTNANAGPGFTAKDVQGVKNNEAPTTGAKAEAAPGEAPKAVAGDAAATGGVPAAGSGAVEGRGVKAGDFVKLSSGDDQRVRQVESVGDDGWVYTKSGEAFKPGQFEAADKPVAKPAPDSGRSEVGQAYADAQEAVDQFRAGNRGWFSVKRGASTHSGVMLDSAPQEKRDQFNALVKDRDEKLQALQPAQPVTGEGAGVSQPTQDVSAPIKTLKEGFARLRAERAKNQQQGNTNGTQTSQTKPQQTQPEAGPTASIPEPAAVAGVEGAGEGIEEPNFQAAKALLAQQKAATGNAVAEGHIRKKLRDLAAKTPISDSKTVSALDIAATRLGMGEGKLKGLEFAPATTPVAPSSPEAVSAQGEGLNDHIRALRAVAHNGIKQGGPKGDVRLNMRGSNLYVPFDVAVAEARKAVAAGMKPVPFQVSSTLDIGIGETDRVIAALSKPEIVVDKAEMRPYRKPDGSVGYEAVPIQEATPAADTPKTGAERLDERIKSDVANKPGTVNVPSTIAEAFTSQMQKQKGRITRLKNEAEKARSLEDKRAAQLKVTAAEATLRQMRLKIFEAEDAAVKAVEAGDVKQFAQYADLFPSAAEEIAKLTGQNDELDAEMQSYEAKANPTYSGEPKPPQALVERAPVATESVAKPEVKANTIFTEDAAAAARARLKAKLNRLNSGIDPEMMMDGITLAGYHMEKGARTFAAFAKAMVDDLGDSVKPYLKSWYSALRYDPRASGFTAGMSSAAMVDEFDMKDVAPSSDTSQLENSADKADTSVKDEPVTAEDTPKESLLGANDDTRRNATNDSEPLDQALPGSDSENGTRGSIETGAGLRPTDAQGNGRPESGGSGRGNSLDGSKKPVLPSTPAEIRPLADGPVGKTEDRPQQLSGENPGNFVITDEFKLGQGTDGDKISGNLAAIRTLRQVQKENRYPTKAEQAIMARYVGWGGLKTVFDPKKADATDQYGKAQRELKSLLSPDEYRAANGSIRNAHYTAEGIVDGMWRVMRFMGFKGGRALEPTIGIGNFVGRMPADMAASTEWHASELDTTTGQLAAMLYPEANILASTGFQDAPFADGAFDISVGNPPFGSQQILDKSPNRKHLNGQKIHNYIIAKTGMHLRPGGVMSMVVTHRFLDTANPEARDVLAKDFRFLGAFRLPNDAFKKNAGTDVVTDVVFLQKLGPEEKRERDASWLDVNGSITVDGQAMRVNRYYQDNQSHILGRSAMDGSMQNRSEPEYTVHSDGRDIGKAIDELMQTGFKHMAGVLEQSNNSKALAPAMLTQSDLPIGGVMVNDEGKIIRRELNDANGNAVVQELTPETLWKDQAIDWQALHGAVLDVRTAAKAGKLTQDDANEVLALSRFLFKADGTPSEKPNKAVEAVYKLVEELAKPAKFQWNHDASLLLITGALNRKQLGEDGYKSLKGMLDLRNRTLRLIHAEQAGDEKMEEYRADLNKAYDAFVKENGYLSDSKNANLLEGDVGAEAGIEANYTPSVSPAVAKSSGTPVRAASATKSDIMSRRVNFPYKEITHAESAADSLFASISEHGKVDLPYMAKITNKSVQSVIEELTKGENPQLFRDPETGEYQEAERYLSGNVKHKLRMAQERGMEANIKALEKALPADKTKEQVKPNIRGMWMPPEIFTEFLQAIGYQDAKISVIASQGMLQASGDKLVMADFGVQFRHGKRTPMDMFNSQASGKPIIITYTSAGKTYKDEQGTKEVNALAERMGKVFQEWAYADDNRVKRIVESFNQNMNTHTPRTFDGVKYLKPVGASPSVVLRRTQLDGAWRMMQEKTMLADHVVGAGKTFTLITGIMERRRMGLSRKPMVVVPNHLVTQWARDFYKLYPGAKVLAANPADFAKKNRRRLLARIATGDYDAVIVGHTSIGFMETPTEDLKAIVDEKLAGLKEALAEARKNNESKRTLGQIEDRIDRYEQRLKDLAARPTDDIGIDFKALGIDHLSVDEAHEFKNLEYSTSGDRVVGMNDPNGSKKAFDLYSKVRGLLSRGGGVTFATGTPVSNSLVEIYTMMSYLAHDELVLRGQEHFDSWSGAYAATETRLEYTATQKLKPRRVLAGLNNLSALRQLYEQFADIITMSDLKRIYTEEIEAKNRLMDERNIHGPRPRTDFPIPKVANGKRKLISGEITPAQKEYMDYLVARMGQIEQNKSDKEYMKIDNALNVLTDARKMSLDIRIVDPGAKRDENGKVATAAKNIKATYDKWDADRGTQLVFCDLSTPAKTAAKEARSIISATVEQLFGKDSAKQEKQKLAGMTFEKQWAYLVEKAEEISDNPAISEEKRDAISEYMSKIEDPEATMNVADIGFSVYDDLKTVLMESGIPESEIAFIHDYNTPDQKEKLFDRVNNGYVRVLIGSSAKMGAGTNAQRRLVALHHMDAPWRPSDVEQREGRIIRQGNMLYERDPDGFEVEISAYSTNQTSDTVMWQILERKSGAIEQFRNGGLDSMEEEGGDSDQYAEFMATSTGNPVFRQKLEAERRLTEIESEIGGALIVRSNAQSFLESYDRRRKAAKTRQDATQSFDPSSASYGGESGTQAEFEAAMKVANDDYLAKYAVWTQKNAAADLAIAKWETEPEDTRGDKPSKPTMPSQPDLYTKSVQSASGYARAIGMALNEAGIDKNAKVTMTTGSIIVTGSPTAAGPYWTVYANNLGENIELESSGAQKASASPRIIMALSPFGISNKLKGQANGYSMDVADLDKGKAEALKSSKIEVDTKPRDAARVELNWFTAQVAFAEVQADIDRGASKNRYIERDKRRNISQNKAVALTDPATHTIDGVKYTTTGLNAHSGYQAVSQATRDSDGVPAIVVVLDKAKGTFSVVMQPKNLRKADKSTNLKQTGASEGNETDVVFSRPRFSRGAQSQANESVERLATGIASHWDNAPKIVVAFDMNDPAIPENVRKEDQRQRSGGATGTPEGFYYRGTVYLMSSKLGTPDDIARVLFHEALGHYGLRGLFGKALKPVLNEISMRRRAEVDAKIKQYGLKMGNKLDRFTAAEEVLAELAQTRPEIGIVQRAIAAIRTWLRQNVPGFRNLRLTDAEIIRSYILPARAFVENSARGFDAGRVEPTFSRIDQTETSNFKKWFGDSKVVDADGKPLVMYHGTNADFSVFDDQLSGTATDAGTEGRGFYFSSNPSAASSNAEWVSGFGEKAGANVMPVYLSLQNPYKISKSNAPRNLEGNAKESKKFRDSLIKQGFDGVEYTLMNGDKTYVAFNQTQIKSATGNNGDFDGTNPDIRFSRSIGDTLTSAANSARDVNLPAGYKVGDLFNSVPGKLNWWHKTVGTQYNLAQRSKPFKRVYDAVQTFINDVSYFATEAADMAPNILPKLESWKDLAKSPLSAADTKALSAPVFEGTLIWARDESGKAVKLETLEAKAKAMTPEQKAQRLLRGDHINEQMLKTWKGLPIDQYERLVNDKYEDSMLKAGIVFKDAELTALFGLSDKQIALYREFRKATDKSLANLAIADMLRFGGKDADPVRDVVLESKSVKDAADTLSKYLRSLADLDPDRATVLMDTANKMIDKGDKAQGLMDRGYAPLSRFGSYTLDVVDANGERAYFGMFESAAEESRMRRKMEGLYPGSRITQGTVSEQAYKMFAGVSPETLELFGDMLGLETQGDDAASQAFQEYLKLAKSSRSAMKRLIQRKGIAGFSEDAGRVLAGFVYSNARQTATSLHMGEMTQAAADNDAFRNQGETQDAAVKLVDYIKNPQEEAQKLRGLLFAQYIGGSVASAMVNMTQPITMTFPWLSQYGGVASAAKQMTAAIKDVGKPSTGDTKLDAALRKAEEDGTVSPQEVHQLLKQSQGRSALQSDDGTRAGYAMALAQNTVSRFSLVWGKLFSVAEQFNRRVTFIAAYRTAVAQGMADPDEFARKAISETQGVYNKGNKPAWARGAVGSTLFTFKQYSIAYVEMLSRMAKSGPEGKKAALLALAVLFLLSGAGGMPGADDLDDVISGAMQAMGYNFDSKMKRKEFFVSLLGEGGAQFVERGVSGLPGVPLDVSGRMGLGNLIPGTGLLTKKADHTRDVAEIAGPAGDFVKRGFDAAGKLITGNVAGAVNSIAPKAIQNITQAFDMANMGMYRDTKGMKVLDTDMGDAVVKAIGFQPNDVKRAQDANSEVARMIGLNKIVETEIANRWAIGIFEKDTDKVQAARDDLAEWNRSNPESPIRINFTQIRSRVQKMNQTKAERIAKTAPREIRAAVRKELADAR